jgi:CheY-like chemotaxis protein
MTRTDILIVEDEKVVGAAAKRILGSEGMSVQVVVDVESALPLLTEQEFTVVLSDLMLPGASGFDLLDHMTANYPDVPFVLMTGYATVENAAKAFEQGAFDILPKPFDSVELVGTMCRTMRFAGRTENCAESNAKTAEVVESNAPERYYLGEHSWAEIEPDGTVKIGAAETFCGLLNDLQWVELPEAGNDLRQGTRAVRMLSEREEVYRVWAPLTGTVLTVNEQLEAHPNLVHQQPHGDGWLVRMFPERLEEELKVLQKRKWKSRAP